MHDEEGISYKTGMCSSSVMKMVISVSPSLIFIFPICWRCVCVWGGVFGKGAVIWQSQVPVLFLNILKSLRPVILRLNKVL